MLYKLTSELIDLILEFENHPTEDFSFFTSPIKLQKQNIKNTETEQNNENDLQAIQEEQEEMQ